MILAFLSSKDGSVHLIVIFVASHVRELESYVITLKSVTIPGTENIGKQGDKVCKASM